MCTVFASFSYFNPDQTTRAEHLIWQFLRGYPQYPFCASRHFMGLHGGSIAKCEQIATSQGMYAASSRPHERFAELAQGAPYDLPFAHRSLTAHRNLLVRHPQSDGDSSIDSATMQPSLHDLQLGLTAAAV